MGFLSVLVARRGQWRMVGVVEVSGELVRNNRVVAGDPVVDQFPLRGVLVDSPPNAGSPVDRRLSPSFATPRPGEPSGQR